MSHGSLHRHHAIPCLTNQCLTQGTLRHVRLNTSQFGWVKAAGGHSYLCAPACQLLGYGSLI